LDMAGVLEALPKCSQTVRQPVRRSAVKQSDHRHRWLLRSCYERPPSCRAAKKRDELATPHSITSSASASSRSGTLRPSALAVFRLITSSNLVGCWTGRSDALAPLRILST